jgi:DNA-binding SARP family transcriptional activator
LREKKTNRTFSNRKGIGMKRDSEDIYWVTWMAERYLESMVAHIASLEKNHKALEAHTKDMAELIARVRAKEIGKLETISAYEQSAGARVQ